MNGKHCKLQMMLVGVWVLVLTAFRVLRTFRPAVVLPHMDVPVFLAASLAACVLEAEFGHRSSRNWIDLTVTAAMCFGLLPLAAGFAGFAQALRMGIIGAAVCLIATVLYDSLMQRLSSAPTRKAAPVIAAVGLFLAGQCFMGMFF